MLKVATPEASVLTGVAPVSIPPLGLVVMERVTGTPDRAKGSPAAVRRATVTAGVMIAFTRAFVGSMTKATAVAYSTVTGALAALLAVHDRNTAVTE